MNALLAGLGLGITQDPCACFYPLPGVTPQNPNLPHCDPATGLAPSCGTQDQPPCAGIAYGMPGYDACVQEQSATEAIVLTQNNENSLVAPNVAAYNALAQNSNNALARRTGTAAKLPPALVSPVVNAKSNAIVSAAAATLPAGTTVAPYVPPVAVMPVPVVTPVTGGTGPSATAQPPQPGVISTSTAPPQTGVPYYDFDFGYDSAQTAGITSAYPAGDALGDNVITDATGAVVAGTAATGLSETDWLLIAGGALVLLLMTGGRK